MHGLILIIFNTFNLPIGNAFLLNNRLECLVLSRGTHRKVKSVARRQLFIFDLVVLCLTRLKLVLNLIKVGILLRCK